MDDWYWVYEVQAGRPRLEATFRSILPANEFLRTSIDSGYVSHMGMVVDRKNITLEVNNAGNEVLPGV